MAGKTPRARRAAPTTPLALVAPTLYTHTPHPHIPRNANERRQAEQAAKVAAGGVSGFNERIAIKLSDAVSTMWTAYAFTALALITIFAVLGWFGVLSPLVAAVGEAVSQTFIQLVFLPILALVSRVQSRQGEIQADEQYHTSLRNSHDIEQVARHQDAQDAVLIELRDLMRQYLAPTVPATPTSPPMAAMAAVTALASTPTTPPSTASNPSRRGSKLPRAAVVRSSLTSPTA
jgi:hypothetical protein